MFGRKKKPQGDVPVQPFPTMTVPTTGGAVPGADVFRTVVPEMMEALRQGEQGLNATVVSTSITSNGHQVDPNSPEGRALMETLGRMGVLGAAASGAPVVSGAAQPMPPAGWVAPAGFIPPAAPAVPVAPATQAAPGAADIDQSAVASAMQQAQADPQKMPQIVALVDDYAHGRIDHARFEAERRRIVGY